MNNTTNINEGDYLIVAAPTTERWSKLSLNKCTWGEFRYFIDKVVKIDDSTVELENPSRMDLPIIDKPYACTNPMITNCCVEGFTLEQEGNLQKDLLIGSILFYNAVNCKAENIKVINTGNRPLYGRRVKNCTFSNCDFEGAWNHSGSTAYAGFDYAWDCLIEDMQTIDMRHGPILNWACSGNVIRNSFFKGSDAQWHSGWCQDNLFEQCVIECPKNNNGSYGYAFYATPYNDSAHGPQGPRNVIYNCKSDSLKAAVFLGGGGIYDWRIMYNNFTVHSGTGIIERLGCRNNYIIGNVFNLNDSSASLVYYEFMDNTGDVIKDNIIYGGNRQLYFGAGKPEICENNKQEYFSNQRATQSPPVPSIYQWQKSMYSCN